MPNPFDELQHNVSFAFPVALSLPDGNGGVHVAFCQGMTLRDWFAGQALAGLCAGRSDLTITSFAIRSYEVADAMLAEMEKK